LNVDSERKLLDERKIELDKLHLTYENLLYQKAHLQREIEKCRDLVTPNLEKVGTERGEIIGITTYSSDLSILHEQAIHLLEEEKQQRIQLQKDLEEKQNFNTETNSKLEKKRKFLLDVGEQVSKIRKASQSLGNMFDEMITLPNPLIAMEEEKESHSNNENPSEASIVADIL
jgi:THO complex subunit 5